MYSCPGILTLHKRVFLFILSALVFEVDELKGLRRGMLMGLTKDMQTHVTKVNHYRR